MTREIMRRKLEGLRFVEIAPDLGRPVNHHLQLGLTLVDLTYEVRTP